MRAAIALLLLFAHVAATLAACGDGILDGGEECDLGINNGASTACCTGVCTLKPASTVCRPANGLCDVAETCTGDMPTCPANAYASSGTACRAAVDACDAPEYCTGLSTSCPADLFRPNGTVCRPAAGDCDAEEVCTGLSARCPINLFKSNTVQCRAAAGPCDLPEYCTGAISTCPPDALVVAGATCRPAQGNCDEPETCDGVDPACPADVLKSSDTVCRESQGDCDVPENCTGVDPVCPGNDLVAEGALCRAAEGDCDLPEYCTGINPLCPPNAFVPLGAVCRALVGECDLDAVCTGRTPHCPPNELRPGTHVCRPSAGPCDPPEICANTNTAFCVADNVLNSGVCRPSRGPCDVAETCQGVPECPPDEFHNTSVQCRPAEGPCDEAEFCPGDAAFCPPDRVLTAFTTCAVSSSLCTTSTYCDGLSTGCPDNVVADGTECSLDGDECFTDSCQNGTCVRGPETIYWDGIYCNGGEFCDPDTGYKVVAPTPGCDDGDSCTIDSCNEISQGCTHSLLPGIGSPCGSDVGECVAGVLQCDGSAPFPVFTCFGEVTPAAETCSDGLDNDCDGYTDEFCTPLACTTDDDCASWPVSTCEVATCQTGFCSVAQSPQGTPCNDGLACTSGDVCNSFGVCIGVPVTCDDQNECTFDTCLEPYGSCVFDGAAMWGRACVHENAFFAECDSRGVCVPTVVVECPPLDLDSCFVYFFNESFGGCDAAPRTGGCDDGNACTVHDTCIDGACIGLNRDCSDGLVCTSDGCNSGTGECLHWLLDNYCYIEGACYADGDPNPRCPCQLCNSTMSQIEWSYTSTELPCDDGDPCTQSDTCRPLDQVCAGVPLDCSAGDSECTVGVCDRGECRIDGAREGEPCDDGSPCTVLDTCRSGVCSGVSADLAAFSFNSGCVIASCNGTEGFTLSAARDFTACNIGADPCAGPFVCLSGACIGVGPAWCPEPSSPCMEAVCEPDYGCSERPLVGQACDDGNACTLFDVCDATGVCRPSGIAVDCDDRDPCTDDLCTSEGGCVHVPVGSCTACRYSEDCSPQLCQYALCIEGQCTYFAHETDTSCSDGDVCNGRETCTGNGVCVSEGPLVCDDGNPCTTDGCDPFAGCYHLVNTSNACDDGDLCTVDDACTVEGECVGDPLPCFAETTCLAQQCFVLGGEPFCVRAPRNPGVWCDPGDPCVHSAVCDEFGECRGQPLECPPPPVCVDSYVCTGTDNATCTPVYTSIGTPCMTNDLCAEHLCNGAGTCVRTQTLVNCSHHDECTAYGVCIPQTGECAFVPVDDGTPCDDGDLCTVSDTCQWGTCVGRDPVVCQSISQCHGPGVCDPLTGQCDTPFLPAGTFCVSGDSCTTSSTCYLGNCIAGDPVDCPHSENQCLSRRCDPHHGCLYDFKENHLCDDDNLCTVDETCLEGTCGGGTPYNCSYSYVCGVSYCSPRQGCLYPVADECHACTTTADCAYIPCKNATCAANVCAYEPMDSAVSGCNDGLWRNGEEFCFAGTCMLGIPPSCDDGNPCTADAYSPFFDGCEHTPQQGLFCKSDNLCAESGICNTYGQCVPYDITQCDVSDDCKISLGCNPGTGQCEYALKEDGEVCVDSNLCSTEAVCSKGVCNPVRTLDCATDCTCKEGGVCDVLTGQCTTHSSCTVRGCSDGNACTLGDACADGECRAGPYSACEWGDYDRQCQVIDCSGGVCSYENVPDYTACSTDIPIGPCSGRDVCLSGSCQRTYAAGEPCRAKAPGGCDVTDHCEHGNDYCPEDLRASDGTPCPDTLFCYENTCQAGECTPTTLRDCSAFDGPCTLGVCDERSRQCVPRSIADDTECVSGEENQCTPFSTCRSGSCTPYYANELTPCDDGDVCTRDSYCSGYDGTCVTGVPADCSYLDTFCGTGFCDTLTGDCLAQSLNEGQPCDADGDVCTVDDTCSGGFCVAGPPVDCSYLDSSCQHGRCVDGACEVVITGPECEPDYCAGGCVVPFPWWALHTSRCKLRSKRFTWPYGLEDDRICGQSFYYWSQKRPRVAWRLLMHQWLASILNEASGACVPPEIETAMGDAYNLLLSCNMTVNVTGAPGRPYRQLASLLGAYNSGAKHPDTCLRPSCAQQQSPSGYFSCLFPQLGARDVEEVSPIDCVNGLWDYVSDVCDCELGWAGPTCTDCGVPDAEDETFLCVPLIGDAEAYILRAIPDQDLPLYINEDAESLRQLLQLSNRVSVYPGTEGLDCACGAALGARDVVTYGGISVYITEIERDLANCEQLFQVVVEDQNLDCDPNTTITIVDSTENCSAPEDWTYICDCCGPDDPDCVCPRNDIMCLRNHLQESRSRMHTFFILCTIFIGLTGLFLFTALYFTFRREKPKKPTVEKRPLVQPKAPIQFKMSMKSFKRRRD